MTVGKMHFDEVDTDLSLVGRLLATQFPQWANLPIEPVHSAGTDNAMYRLGNDMVVRLPRIHWAVEAVEREHRWLPPLAPLLPVAIPIPLGTGTPGEGYPWHWSVYRWLEGENPAVDRIADPHLLAMEIAEFVAALQRIDPADGPPAGPPLAMQDAQVRTSIEALRGMIDTDAATDVWEADLQIPEWTGPPVWLHSDLAPGNVLLVEGRLSAVIDFSGVGVGDPSGDLRVAWNLLPAGVRNIFRAALQVDDATWARGRGRALAQALVQLPYYRGTNPLLAYNARHVIHEVLTDHKHGS
ncbi:MAG: aminoglycoside phosphotransferase family protein [Chloroflexia bacterium]